MKEIVWKEIPSTNGRYEASNDGRIRWVKELKQFESWNGYKILSLRAKPCNQTTVRVHRLVAEAFLGKCPTGLVVNHKDGNKKNNTIENLEYVTKSEDNKHALDLGLRRPPQHFENYKRGEDHPFAKLNEQQVLEIRKIRKETKFGERRISKMLNLPRGAVGHVIKGKSWKHIKEE